MEPNNNFTIPPVNSFEHLIERAQQQALTTCPRTALVVPSDPETLKAFSMAAEMRLIEPWLIGDEQLVLRKAAELGLNLESATFIDIRQPDLAVSAALKMAVAGELNLLVKGRMATVDFLQILFDKSLGFVHSGHTVSHVAVIKPTLYPKLLFLTDAAVNVDPDLKCKLALIENAVKLASHVGVKMPRIAMLAAVEVVYPQMPVTMDAAIIAKMADRGQIKGAYVDGPLSFDTAVDMFAAEAKGIKNSPVAGQADILIAPNLETANGVYKAMTLYGRAELGGVILGGRVPVALGSRSDSVENRFKSIALGVLSSAG